MTNLIARRNFLLGIRNAGILVLMPPALTLPQLEKRSQLVLGTKGPELCCASIEGIVDGSLTRSCAPEPHSLLLKSNFTLTASSEVMDLRPVLGDKYRFPCLAEYSMSAWVRSEIGADLYSYLGKPVHISAQAAKNVFYSGNFLITEVRNVGEFKHDLA